MSSIQTAPPRPEVVLRPPSQESRSVGLSAGVGGHRGLREALVKGRGCGPQAGGGLCLEARGGAGSAQAKVAEGPKLMGGKEAPLSKVCHRSEPLFPRCPRSLRSQLREHLLLGQGVDWARGCLGPCFLVVGGSSLLG